MKFGDVPTKKVTLQMTSASRLSPKVNLALQNLTRNFFRIENVVSVRLAKSARELPSAAYADSCTLVHSDNDVNPCFHCYEAEGTTLDSHDISGSAHSRSTQRLKPAKSPAGFDPDMTKFEDLADAPTQDEYA
eukprot:2757516-Pyramimonas_sp.AAC.1